MGSDRNILPVTRSREEAKANYDRISGIYDQLEGVWEKKYREQALAILNIQEGEEVLEVGYGTGHDLCHLAERVGASGKVYGIDLSEGMYEQASKRLEKQGLSDRVELRTGDALRLPYTTDSFDAAYMSFTLELFDTPEIPEMLRELHRALRRGGRACILSLSKEQESFMSRLYEKGHQLFPKLLDCRPIYVKTSMEEEGFRIERRKMISVFGLPAEIVIGMKD